MLNWARCPDMVLSPFCDGKKVHQQTLKKKKKTDTQVCVWNMFLPGAHSHCCLSFPFWSLDPRSLSPGNAHDGFISRGLAGRMRSSGTVSVGMERGRDISVRAQQVGCLPVGPCPPALGRPWLLSGAEGQHHVGLLCCSCRCASGKQLSEAPFQTCSLQTCWFGATTEWSAGSSPLASRNTRTTSSRAACTGRCWPWTRRLTSMRWPSCYRSPRRTHRCDRLPVQTHSWLPERRPNLTPQTAGPLVAHQVPHGIVHGQRRFMPRVRACPLFLLCRKHGSLS